MYLPFLERKKHIIILIMRMQSSSSYSPSSSSRCSLSGVHVCTPTNCLGSTLLTVWGPRCSLSGVHAAHCLGSTLLTVWGPRLHSYELSGVHAAHCMGSTLLTVWGPRCSRYAAHPETFLPTVEPFGLKRLLSCGLTQVSSGRAYTTMYGSDADRDSWA